MFKVADIVEMLRGDLYFTDIKLGDSRGEAVYFTRGTIFEILRVLCIPEYDDLILTVWCPQHRCYVSGISYRNFKKISK